MAPQVMISLNEGVLGLYLRPDDWLTRGHCATVHLEIDCPTARDYQTGRKYQPLRSWVCESTCVAEDTPHCARHWFGPFCVYAQNGQPVAVAASLQQLAAILQLSEVRLCGASTKQPVALPEGLEGIATQQQQQQGPAQPAPAQQQQQDLQETAATAQPMDEDPPVHQKQLQDPQQQQQQQQRPNLQLSIPKPGTATVRSPCCAVMVMVDVGSPPDFVRGPVYKVLYSWCCGREGGSKDFCKLHMTSRFVLLDRNLAVMATVNTVPLLAANLGYASINITSEQQDLLQKLSNLTDASATAAAAAAAADASNADAAVAGASSSRAAGGGDGSPRGSERQQLQQPRGLELAGQKRSSAEAELPLPGPAAKLAANGRSGPAAASAGVSAGKVTDGPPAVLRLQLSGTDAAKQQAVLQERQHKLQQQQNEKGGKQDQQQQQQGVQQELQRVQVELGVLEQLCGAGLDVCLPVTQGSSSSAATRCMGVTLQLGVKNLQELADASTFVRILNGRRCGHEGGTKRACKKHRLSTFNLLSATGEPLTYTTHLAGLAHRLKVSSVSLLEAPGAPPMAYYLSLPATPTWRKAADSSKLTVWLPPDGKGLPGNWQQRPCCGLDVYVARPQNEKEAVGSPVSIMSIVRCGNEAGVKTACKRHTTQGPLQLFSWSDSLAGATFLSNTPGGAVIHACSDLAQLAMWLGVGKVEVLDADTNEPLPSYTNLGIPPAVQLPLTGALAFSQASLAPPSLGVGMGPPQGAAAAAAATAAAAGVAAVRLDGSSGSQGEDAAAAAAGGAAGGLAGMLAAAAQAGGLKAVNLFGNSRVEVVGSCDAQQQQQQDQQEQQQQQQQQGEVVCIRVEPRPVGGNQGRPCCMLDVVLLLQDKGAYQQGQQYPILFAQRCGNEAGNRSRCRQHADCALRIVATDPPSVSTATSAQGVPSYAVHSAKPALTHGIALAVVQDATVVCKVNSSRDAAAILGVGGLRLLDGFSGEDLGDLSAWSPTNASGTAAKVAAPSRDAAATAAALAAVAAAGVPGVPNAQALLAALAAGRVPGVNLGGPTLTKVQQYELDTNLVPAAGVAAGGAAAGGSGLPKAAAAAAGGGALDAAGAAGVAASPAAPAAATPAEGAGAAGNGGGVTPGTSAAQALAAAAAAAVPPAPAPAATTGPGVSGDVDMADARSDSDAPVAFGAAAQPAATVAATSPAAATLAEQQQLPVGSTPTQDSPTAAEATGAVEPAAAAAAAAQVAQPPTAAAAAAVGSGPGAPAPVRAAFGSSAPRHLATWAINFKPPTPAGSAGSGGQP